MIELKAIASSYTKSIYVIFGENDYIDKYEIYRNDTLIGTYLKEELHFNHQGEDGELVRPCMFDRDHHTNLFFKDSNHQWMYEDKNVKMYQEYKYYVKYYHGDYSENTEIDYVTLQ